MINLGVLLVGFILGVFALALLVFLVALHRPRYIAPTRHNRERKTETPEEPIYMYGVTGEER